MNIFFINQVGTYNYLYQYLKYCSNKKKKFKIYFSEKFKKINFPKKSFLKIQFIKTDKNIIRKTISKFKPKKIILSSSGNSILEKNVILVARQNNIQTFSIIDTWDNLKMRFKYENKYFLPNNIMCIDSYSKKKIKKIFTKTRVIKIGQPYLEEILIKGNL